MKRSLAELMAVDGPAWPLVQGWISAELRALRRYPVITVRAGGDREMTLGDVLVRVSPKYALDLHVDTDEANAAALTSDSVVAFEGVQARRPAP